MYIDRTASPLRGFAALTFPSLLTFQSFPTTFLLSCIAWGSRESHMLRAFHSIAIYGQCYTRIFRSRIKQLWIEQYCFAAPYVPVVSHDLFPLVYRFSLVNLTCAPLVTSVQLVLIWTCHSLVNFTCCARYTRIFRSHALNNCELNNETGPCFAAFN